MRLLACVAVVCAVTGCATTGNSPNAALTSTGRIAGVVKLPEQLSSAQPCDRISVVALSGDVEVGKAFVRQSRSRCSYEITNLPTNVDVGLQVKVDGLQCANGADVSASSDTVKLQDGEIKTKDLQTSCS